jgi:hypothetical protein
VTDGDFVIPPSTCAFSESSRQERGEGANEKIAQCLAPADASTGEITRQLVEATVPPRVFGH